MERLSTSSVSVSNGKLKYLIGKSIFALNLPLKIFRVMVANANTESLKSLKSIHTLFYTYLDCMLTKFEPNRIVYKYNMVEGSSENY